MPKKAARSAKAARTERRLAKKDEQLTAGDGPVVWAFRGAMAVICGIGALTSGWLDFLFRKSTRTLDKEAVGDWAPERVMDAAVAFCTEHAHATAGVFAALILAPVGHWVLKKWQAAEALRAKEESHRQADADAKQQRAGRREQKAESKARGREAAAAEHRRWLEAEADYSRRQAAALALRAMRQESAREQLAALERMRAAEAATDRQLAEDVARRWDAEQAALEDLLKGPEIEQWEEEDDDQAEGEEENAECGGDEGPL